MKQTLRIFAKDTRHLYREILISLALTAAFIKLYPITWGDDATTIWLPPWLPYLITSLVPVSWLLLIARVIHDESLVGERQFWVTRPYKWQSLLAAKTLFIFTYALVPYFIALCLLLRIAGFHPMAWLPGVLFNVLMAICIIITPLVLLASITPTIGKMTAWLLGVVLFVGLVAYITTFLPTASASTELDGHAYATLIECAFVAIIINQFSKRRTTVARIMVIASAITIASFALFSPDDMPMNLVYPVHARTNAPSPQLAFDTDVQSFPEVGAESRSSPEVDIDLPIHFSAIPAGIALKADNAKVLITAQNGDHWESHWQSIDRTWLPGQAGTIISLKISAKFFDHIKKQPVTTQLTVATTTLKAGKPTQVQLTLDDFAAPGGAICHSISKLHRRSFACRSANRQPALMLVSTHYSSECVADPALLNDGSYGAGWLGSDEKDPADFGITSVWTTDVVLQDADPGSGGYLCPGSTLSFTPYTITDRRQQKLKSSLVTLGD